MDAVILQDALAALDPAAFARAEALLGQGDAAAASAEVARHLAEKPGAPGEALLGVVAAASGDAAAARAALRRAQALAPGQAWPHVLESFVLRGAGDPSGAADALGRALRAQPSASLHAERARVWEEVGHLPHAIEDAAQAVRLCPCAEHHLLKAHLHECWREYALAAEEFDRALAAEPGRWELLAERSRMNSALGRFEAAHRDAAAALSARPGDEHLLFRELQLSVLKGGDAGAAARLDALAAEGSPARAKALFLRGYAFMLDGRFIEALPALDACVAIEDGSALGRKAAFFKAVAVALDGSPRGPLAGAAPQLVLAGLGLNPPFSASVEALRALQRCEVVFNNVTGEELFEFLRVLCRDVRPLAYHQSNDEAELAETMVTELRAGRNTGFVTRGHATVYGGLGPEIIRRCRAEGLPFLSLPGLCSADGFMAAYGRAGAPAGSQVLDTHLAAAEPGLLDPVVPLTLYMGAFAKAADYEALTKRLEAAYGPEHACLLFDNRVDQEPLRVRMDGLAGLWSRIQPSSLFFIPGRAA